MKYLMFLLAGLFFISCNNDGDSPEMIEEMEETLSQVCDNCIDLNDPQVGQLNRYVLYTDVNYYNDMGNGQYRPDTLIVELKEVDGNELHLTEYLSAGSNLVLNPDVNPRYYWDDIEENPVVWNLSGGILEIQKNTPLGCSNKLTFQAQNFSFSSQDTLGAIYTDWLPDIDWRGDHTQDIEINNNTYNYLQMLVQNGAMAADGNGMTFLYSKDYGFVRCYTYSSWTGDIIGWDLLVE